MLWLERPTQYENTCLSFWDQLLSLSGREGWVGVSDLWLRLSGQKSPEAENWAVQVINSSQVCFHLQTLKILYMWTLPHIHWVIILKGRHLIQKYTWSHFYKHLFQSYTHKLVAFSKLWQHWCKYFRKTMHHVLQNYLKLPLQGCNYVWCNATLHFHVEWTETNRLFFLL